MAHTQLQRGPAPRHSRFLVGILKPLLGIWLRKRFRILITEDEKVRALKPPYLVLPNHVNFWDPFLVGTSLPHTTYFMAADGNFRSTIMRMLLPLFGAIPKAKARNDLESIRALQTLVAGRQTITLYAEGQRTWDGESRPLLPGIEKLVRLLGAPVLAVRMRGAYLATPRWSRHHRRGQVVIEKELIITAAEARRLSRNEIATRIANGISVDETAWQRSTGFLYHGRRRAEHVEWTVFFCPTCSSFGTLRSTGNEFFCTNCTERHWIAPSGRLYKVDKNRGVVYPRFASVAAWNAYQMDVLRTTVATAVDNKTEDILKVESCRYLTGYRSRPLVDKGDVSISISWDRVRIDPVGTVVPISELSGVHVQFIEQLEFYAYGRLHVLRFIKPHDSAYRVEQTINELYRRIEN